MQILSFNTEIDAQIAVKKIWVETVRDALTESLPVWDGEQFVTDVSGYSEDQIAALTVCGKVEADVQVIDGLTYRYDLIEKSVISDNWFFQKCGDKYLSFISDYTIMELPASWVPPDPG